MADYDRMVRILRDAVIKELLILSQIPKAHKYVGDLGAALNFDGMLSEHYAVLCGTISDGIDGLAGVPLAHESAANLLWALEQAEEVYIETTPYVISVTGSNREDCSEYLL